MEERVEQLMKMVKEAAGSEGDSDEEDDDDVEIVRQAVSWMPSVPVYSGKADQPGHSGHISLRSVSTANLISFIACIV